MTYTYHLLAPTESVYLGQLMQVFGEAFEDIENYQSRVPSDTYHKQFLSSQEHIVLVALHDEMVVGGLVAYILQKFEQERSEMYIYDLAVLKPHRRKGVATRLIEELKSVARERGVGVIFVQADIGDEPAIRLYEKLGKKEEVLHFDIPADRPK